MNVKYIEGDTIAACATAPGEGGVAIVRVSGPDAEGMMRRFFKKLPERIESHRMYYGHIVGAGAREEALCVLMRAPRSYTREDVCEFNIHGGGETVARLLRALYNAGVRPAEPGEFTRRAFMNGRIDLSRAEAVMSVLRAKGDAALRAGLREMDGGIAREVGRACGELTGMLAEIGAALDFPEEIDETEIEAGLIPKIRALSKKLNEECGRRAGDMLSRGLSAVLAGRPNVGKSSLMNALLGCERAIVTRAAGTTRDVLTEELELSGYRVRLSDTAGQRDADNEAERMGVERARAALKACDIALMVLDRSEPLTGEDLELLDERDERQILILNKADLPRAWDASDLTRRFDGRTICVSARSGEGIADLRRLMSEKAAAYAEPGAIFLHERHISCVRRACVLMDAAAATLEAGASCELAALDLSGALSALGEITGQTADVDVINRIFTDFCVGK